MIEGLLLLLARWLTLVRLLGRSERLLMLLEEFLHYVLSTTATILSIFLKINILVLLIRLGLHSIFVCFSRKLIDIVLRSVQLFSAVILHLDQLLHLAGLVHIRVLIRILWCKAVIVDIDAEELALPISVDHELDSRHLLLLLLRCIQVGL